jgi:aryl-alcohol dehydrogenase-like predicted oxidoreductase
MSPRPVAVTVTDRLGFGCAALSTLGSPRAVRHLLEGVLEQGIRHFDTAPAYGRGYSERLLGEFVRDKRDQVSIATKFGLAPAYPPLLPPALAMRLNALRRRIIRPQQPSIAGPGAPVRPTGGEVAKSQHIDRATVQQAFDNSRRSLRTDYVDLYLLHENLPFALKPEAMELLLRLRAAGHIRQLGLAANGSRYLTLSDADLAHWDVLQYEYGPAWPAHAGLPAQFPMKTHIFHSCLRGVVAGPSDANGPGQVLATCLSANPSGRVLFSSTKLDHVRENLRALTARSGPDADH